MNINRYVDSAIFSLPSLSTQVQPVCNKHLEVFLVFYYSAVQLGSDQDYESRLFLTCLFVRRVFADYHYWAFVGLFVYIEESSNEIELPGVNYSSFSNPRTKTNPSWPVQLWQHDGFDE